MNSLRDSRANDECDDDYTKVGPGPQVLPTFSGKHEGAGPSKAKPLETVGNPMSKEVDVENQVVERPISSRKGWQRVGWKLWIALFACLVFLAIALFLPDSTGTDLLEDLDLLSIEIEDLQQQLIEEGSTIVQKEMEITKLERMITKQSKELKEKEAAKIKADNQTKDAASSLAKREAENALNLLNIHWVLLTSHFSTGNLDQIEQLCRVWLQAFDDGDELSAIEHPVEKAVTQVLLGVVSQINSLEARKDAELLFRDVIKEMTDLNTFSPDVTTKILTFTVTPLKVLSVAKVFLAGTLHDGNYTKEKLEESKLLLEDILAMPDFIFVKKSMHEQAERALKKANSRLSQGSFMRWVSKKTWKMRRKFGQWRVRRKLSQGFLNKKSSMCGWLSCKKKQ